MSSRRVQRPARAVQFRAWCDRVGGHSAAYSVGHCRRTVTSSSSQCTAERVLAAQPAANQAPSCTGDVTRPLAARRCYTMPENGRTTSEEEILPPEGWEPLPADANYTSPGYRAYQYRGVTVNNSHLAWGIMHQLETFQGRRSDIIVASFPKSGTTWLQEIVWRVTHHDQIATKGEPGVPLEFRFPILDHQPQKDLLHMDSLDELPDPRFIKTHLHYHMLPESVKKSGAKMLYVSRDARDVCVSNYHFSRMINIHKYRGTFAEYLETFMRGTLVYCPYREHVKGYLQHSDTVLCLTYEQMHRERGAVVRKVADFLGVQLTDEGVEDIVSNTSFEVMKANPDTNFRQWENTDMVSGTEEGTFMRKGVVGDWRNYFNEEENGMFMKWWKEDVKPLE